MSKLYTTDPGDMLMFECPGCGNCHWVFIKVPELNSPNRDLFDFNTRNGRQPLWTWNGSMNAPTFSPSVLSSPDNAKYRCHSFVKDGKIQFLMDCHHSLRGQTVELPEVEK